MPRGSNGHRSHKQHRRHLSKDFGDSDEGENSGCGSDLRLDLMVGGNGVKDEIKAEPRYEGQKRKYSAQPRELGPGNAVVTFSSKKKKLESSAIESDASALSYVPLTTDRWDGGEMQADALSTMAYLKHCKDKESKTDSDESDRVMRATQEDGESRTEDKNKKSGKGKDINTSMQYMTPFGNGADTTYHLQNVKVGRNKNIKRRELQDIVTEQGTSSKLAEESPLLEKALSDAIRMSKSIQPRSSMKGRWDKGYSGRDSKETDDGDLSCNVDGKPEKIAYSPRTFHRNASGKKAQTCEKDSYTKDSSLKQHHKNTECRIQNALHNIELEKEQDYRIQRRKDEFMDKDRWPDDERDVETNRFYRCDRQGAEKIKNDKYRDEEYKGEKRRDDRFKDERCREDRYVEDCYKNDRNQDAKHREHRSSREHIPEKSDIRHSREGNRVTDGRYRDGKNHDIGRGYGYLRDDCYSQSRDDTSRNQINDMCRSSKPSSGSKTFSAEYDGKAFSKAYEEDLRNEKLGLGHCDGVYDKQLKRMHADVDREENRLKFKYSQIDLKERLSDEKIKRNRGDRSVRTIDHFSGYERETGVQGKRKSEKDLDEHGDESPHLSTRSSAYEGKSPVLSHFENSPNSNGGFGGLPYHIGKSKHSFDSCREKQPSVTDGLNSREAQGTAHDYNRKSSNLDKSLMPNNTLVLDESSRTSSVLRPGTKADDPQESGTKAGGHSVSSEKNSKVRRLDEISSTRPDRSAHSSNIRSQIPSKLNRSGALPPPPPLRPGVDNPIIIGSSISGLEDGAPSRDRRDNRQAASHFKRGDILGGSGQGDSWKGAGSWNSQGQGPNNMFIPFQHHMAGHPHSGFVNVRQQYPGPALFGIRPSTEMSSVRFHLRDVGDSFKSQNHPYNWQRQADEVCGSHMHASRHGWEPPSYGDESHVYGRPARDAISGRSWDRGTDIWKVNMRDADEPWGMPQVPRARVEKRRERSPTESIEIKRSDDCPPKIAIDSNNAALKTDNKKLSKIMREKMSVYLSKVDISPSLAGPELFNDCARILDHTSDFSPPVKKNVDDMTPEIDDESISLEADTEAEDFLDSLNTCAQFFPLLPMHVFEEAMTAYEKRCGKAKEENEGMIYIYTDVDPCESVTTSSNTNKTYSSWNGMSCKEEVPAAVQVVADEKTSGMDWSANLTNSLNDSEKITNEGNFVNSLTLLSDASNDGRINKHAESINVEVMASAAMIRAVGDSQANLALPNKENLALPNKENLAMLLEESNVLNGSVSATEVNHAGSLSKSELLSMDSAVKVSLNISRSTATEMTDNLAIESLCNVPTVDVECSGISNKHSVVVNTSTPSTNASASILSVDCAITVPSNPERGNDGEDNCKMLDSEADSQACKFLENCDNVDSDLSAGKLEDTVDSKVGTRNFAPYNLLGDTR